jgi:hypothetical protein
MNLKYTILAIAGIALLAIMYQSMIVVPQQQIEAEIRQTELKLNAEREAALMAEIKYDSCMADAYSNYSSNWDGKCELEGREADCSLFPYEYETIETRHKEAQDRCLTMFK